MWYLIVSIPDLCNLITLNDQVSSFFLFRVLKEIRVSRSCTGVTVYKLVRFVNLFNDFLPKLVLNDGYLGVDARNPVFGGLRTTRA